MPTPKSTYLIEIKELLTKYGIDKIAALLGKTQRAVSYWVAEGDAKIPNIKSQNTIHELFVKHRAGEPLEAQQSPDSEKDKKIADLLERENKRLQKDIDVNLKKMQDEIRLIRTNGIVIRNMVVELLAKQQKRPVREVAHEKNKEIAELYSKISQTDILNGS